jgi:hypothetical protein
MKDIHHQQAKKVQMWMENLDLFAKVDRIVDHRNTLKSIAREKPANLTIYKVPEIRQDTASR